MGSLQNGTIEKLEFLTQLPVEEEFGINALLRLLNSTEKSFAKEFMEFTRPESLNAKNYIIIVNNVVTKSFPNQKECSIMLAGEDVSMNPKLLEKEPLKLNQPKLNSLHNLLELISLLKEIKQISSQMEKINISFLEKSRKLLKTKDPHKNLLLNISKMVNPRLKKLLIPILI